MRALVIVGHGSHLNEDSSLPVYEHAAEDQGDRRVRRGRGVLLERGALHAPRARHRGVGRRLRRPRVYLRGIFHPAGHPAGSSAWTGPVTRKGEKTVRYAGPLGTFEGMPDVILERTDDLMRGKEVSGRTALVLLGHGTDLNKNSGGVIYLNAGRIRERGSTTSSK